MTTNRTRKLAVAFAVAGAVALPLAGCGGGGTTAAPATVTVGPGGIATKAPGLCETSGKYVPSVPVDCADPSERNPMPVYSHQAQERADQAERAAHPGFPWWGWALIVGGVGFVGWMVLTLGPTVAADVKKADAAAPAARPAPAVLDYPEDFFDNDDFDDDDDDFDDDEPVASTQTPARQPDGSFLAELQQRLEEGN